MRALVLLLAAACTLAACSYDFDAFSVDGDGGAPSVTSSTPDSASAETSVPVQTDGEVTIVDSATADVIADADPPDVTTSTDASVADASVTDAKPADAATPDSSTTPDASPTDASTTPDVSTTPDASPTDAAVVDASPADAAPTDAGCVPSASCLSTAVTCGNTCQTTFDQCFDACRSPKCKDDCRTAETQCRDSCAATCNSCTSSAGCPSPTQCDVAAR